MRNVRWMLAFVLMASLLFVVPLYAGPQPPTTAHTAVANIPAANPDLVLYDQTDSPATAGYGSQNFEALYDTYDNSGADDFVVPANIIWTVEQIMAVGSYSAAGPVTTVNVTFFRDNAGLPGTQVFQEMNAPTVASTTGTLTTTLTVPAQLGPGTYWVAYQANLDFGTGGQWYWTARTMQTNSAAAWENPGDAFGSGCITWTTRGSCIAGSSVNPDNLFRLLGTTRPPLAVNVADMQASSAPAPWLPLAAIVLVGSIVLLGRKALKH